MGSDAISRAYVAGDSERLKQTTIDWKRTPLKTKRTAPAFSRLPLFFRRDDVSVSASCPAFTNTTNAVGERRSSGAGISHRLVHVVASLPASPYWENAFGKRLRVSGDRGNQRHGERKSRKVRESGGVHTYASPSPSEGATTGSLLRRRTHARLEKERVRRAKRAATTSDARNIGPRRV